MEEGLPKKRVRNKPESAPKKKPGEAQGATKKPRKKKEAKDATEMPQQEVGKEATDATEMPQNAGEAQGALTIPHAKKAEITGEARRATEMPQHVSPFSAEETMWLKQMVRDRMAQPNAVFYALPAQIPDVQVEAKDASPRFRVRDDLMETALAMAKKVWPEAQVNKTHLINFLLLWFSGLDADPRITSRERGEAETV